MSTLKWSSMSLLMLCLLVIVVASAAPTVALAQGPAPHEVWSLRADIPYAGDYGVGEAYIYKSDPNGPIDWPIIVTDGLDHGDDRKWEGLYGLLNRENFIEDARASDLDFIVLNFSDGSGYIQRNAFLLIKLIQEVNNVKSGESELVVLAPSMGGLVARYALSYMESQDLPHHNVRLFISFDSPQRGANIPLGLQKWVSFFARVLPEENREPAVEGLQEVNAVAAQQMLVYHHLHCPAALTPPPPGSLSQCDSPLRVALLNELQLVRDYPENLRKIAIANGSGTAQSQSFGPGEQILRWRYRSFEVDIDGNVWAVPDGSPRTRIFRGLFDTAKLFDEERSEFFIEGSLPYDNAPGSMERQTEDIADANTGGNGDITTNHPHHTFIPTISALDIATSDLFFDNPGAGDSIYNLTPFDKIYFPTANQDHIQFTSENKTWALNEIFCALSRSGNSEILGDCATDGDFKVTEGDVIVKEDVTFTILAGGSIDLDSGHSLKPRKGAKVIMQPGSRIY